MKHKTLQDLRDEVEKLQMEVTAVENNIFSTKEEAKNIANLFRSTQSQDDFDDLSAINQRFLELEVVLDRKKQRRDEAIEALQNWYHQRKPLDWEYRIVSGKHYSGWNSRLEFGTVLLIDRELCPTEVDFLANYYHCYAKAKLTELAFIKQVPKEDYQYYRDMNPNDIPDHWEKAYHFALEVPEYRGSCWGEVDGKRMMDKLAELIAPTKFLEQLSMLKSFEVLGGGR